MGAIKPIFFLLLFCLGVNYLHAQNIAAPKKSKDSLPIKIDTLKAAIVTAAVRPRMMGDTLEYDVSNSNLPPNAVVEELLRSLPGLHVSPDGTITYNGQKIQRLLVDGQDILGSDPTIVSRSFDAAKIARVQILDRKSEDALFTGIDDGARTKTLNLVLKESAKDSYFGKIELGGGAKGYYNTNGVLAAFRGKEQFTAVGMSANTGVVGTNGNNGAEVGFLYGISDPLGASAGTGIPQFTGVALHYANTWDGIGKNVNGNYQFSHYSSHPITSSQTYQTQAGTTYGQNQLSESFNKQDQHWIDLMYEWSSSEESEFRFKFRGYNTVQNNQYSAVGNSSFGDTLVNNSQRMIQDEMNRQNIVMGADWRIQLGKRAGQILSVTTDMAKADATTNGYLNSLNEFYQPNGLIQRMDTVDQRKQILDHEVRINASVNYAEPLWKGAILGLRYRFSFDGDHPFQGTFNRGDGKYQDIVDSLTSNLKDQEINHRIVLSFQGKIGNLGYALGNDVIFYDYRQLDRIADTLLRQHYINAAPRLMLNYTANKSTSLTFNYNATTQQPNISQLTPIKNNNNPLYITLGNPDLKPSVNQGFEFEFHRFKTWGVNVDLTFGVVNSSISVKTITDSLGRQISQPVNVDGARTSGLNVFVARTILGFHVGFQANAIYSQSVNYINADLSRNDAFTGGGGFTLKKYAPDRYNFQLETNLTYFDQESSINTSAPMRYWTQRQQGSVSFYMIKGIDINTSALYTWQQRTNAFVASTSVLLWNAYISRNFLHNRLAVKVQFNNILNQNAGISRTSSVNINTQSSTNILGRYWMLGVIYHFDQKIKK